MPFGFIHPRSWEVKKTLLMALANFMNWQPAADQWRRADLHASPSFAARYSLVLMSFYFSDLPKPPTTDVLATPGGYPAYRQPGLRLWESLESPPPQYGGRTTFVVMLEFGRDPDGSTSNGFFNHRSDTIIQTKPLVSPPVSLR